MIKENEYIELVKKRKNCHVCGEKFKNQSHWPKYDTDQIGNWSTWANNLDAEIVIVGQDYASQCEFNQGKGKIDNKENVVKEDKSSFTTATNYFLIKLVEILGYNLDVPTKHSNTKIFLTNSVLCMKEGPMNAPIPTSVYKNCGKNFLKPLVDIIQPKAVITLGKEATRAAIRAFLDKKEASALLKLSFNNLFLENRVIYPSNNSVRIFPVYHSGPLGQKNRKVHDPIAKDGDLSGWELQQVDWRKIKENYLS